jgi:hypothetical protein
MMVRSPPGTAAAPANATASASQAESPGYAPPVIYIAGSGRCGSTLLERVLGQIPGYVNVGELIELAMHTAPLGERCGCGQATTDCPFWTAVGNRAFGGWDSRYLDSVRRRQIRVVRRHHRIGLRAIERADRKCRTDLAALGVYYESLYRAIAAESGAACVVDASLEVIQALALAGAGIDVRVIHLVRDVRGVAHSLSKRVVRPHALNGTEFMWRTTPAVAAVMWVLCMNQVKLLRQRGIPVAQMRYEDFVCQPREAVEAALGQLGLPPDPSGLAHIGDRRVVLGPSHGLSGNPSRFLQGELILRPDEAWRDQMSRHNRILVSMIGLQYLLRYGGRRSGEGHFPPATPETIR